MNKVKRHLALVLSIIIAMTAIPSTTHATGMAGAGRSGIVTVDGIDYSISQSSKTVKVTASKSGRIVDSCTANLVEGYMIYRGKNQSNTKSKLSTVSWIDDISPEAPSLQGPQLAPIVDNTWIRDGKYIYNPTRISIYPQKFKEHTAYYWYRELGTRVANRDLNLTKGMAITQIVAVVTAIVVSVASCGLAPADALILAILVGGGSGAFTQGVLSCTISRSVRVLATNYEAKFTNAAGDGLGHILKGSKIRVVDPNSSSFHEVYYEKYCPQRSEQFGLIAFMHTFKGDYYTYPGVRSYVEL